jgi:predicted transcriptional regulator
MDWKKLISDLVASGLTQAAIASHIGVTQGAISQVLRADPDARRGFKYEPGRKLIALHAERVIGKTEKEVA